MHPTNDSTKMLRTTFKPTLRAFSRTWSSRYGSTLAFIETANEEISPASLSTLDAARKLNQPILAVLFGESAKAVATKSLPKALDGVSKVFVASDSRYNHVLPETTAPLLVKLIKDPQHDISHFVVPLSFSGKSLLPRVASHLDVQPISDVTHVLDLQTFKRFIYAGNAVATVKSNDKTVLFSVRASSFDASPVEGGEKPIEELSFVETESNAAEWIGEDIVKLGRPDLASAKCVVSGGRGLGSKENFDALMEPLANSLGAAIGASRAAVDAGYVDNSLQVGQTGKIIAPELYVSVGISGAIQHLAGMKDSKTIVAINKEEDAAIFKVADFGIVGDLNEVVPELTKAINEAKAN